MENTPASRPRARTKVEPVVMQPVRAKKSFFRKYFSIILIVLVILLGLATAYFYKKSQAGDTNAAEVKSLVAKVGKIAVLPADETPTIATVSDPEALRDQAFFAEAKMGDKVLIYSVAKKAILYDPVADKIVNIAPLNVETENAGAVERSSTPPPTTSQ